MVAGRRSKVSTAADSPETTVLGASTAQSSPWRALVLLTLVAAILRAVNLDSGLWFDEIVTLEDTVRPPLLDIVTRFPGNNQHSFYSVLAHVSVESFGERPWSLRLPAFLFGVAMVPVLYRFGKTITTAREALFACLLLAVSYHHVWFSQNARGYTALALFTLLATDRLLSGMRRPSMAAWAGWGLAVALGLYTHLTMGFVVVTHLAVAAAWIVWSGNLRRWEIWKGPLLGSFLGAGLALLLYAPVLFEVHGFFAAPPESVGPATTRWALLETLRGMQVGLGTWIAVASVGFLLTTGLFGYLRQDPALPILFVMPGVLTLGVAVLMGRPVFPRFLFFQIGFALLLLVRGASEVARFLPGSTPRTAAALVFVLAGLSAFTLPGNYARPKQDFEGALRFVEEARQPEDAVVTAGLAARVYRGYYGRPWPKLGSTDELASLLSSGRRVWFLYTLPTYLKREEPELMDVVARDCGEPRVFPGTLAGGQVVVCRFLPTEVPS